MTRPRRILLIDENSEDRVLMVRELTREFVDLQILEIKDAASFEEVLRQQDIDLVITDFRLTWSDGLKVLEEIKSRCPECPVIMVTGAGNEEIAVAAMKAGVDDYINKSLQYLQELPKSVGFLLERSRERQARRLAEACYARLYDRAPVGLYRITPKGEVLEANPAMAEIVGYENPAELLAVNSREFYLHAEDQQRWRQLMAHNGAVRDFEIQLKCRDGKVIWVRNNAQAIRDEAGRIIYYEGSSEDITARKLAEEALKDSEAKYRLLFESNPQPMLVCDFKTLAILKVNQAAVEYYGYSREEFLALTIKDIRPPEDVPALLDWISRLTPGISYSGEWRHRKKSGEIVDVEIASHGIAFNGREARLVLVNDITSRKRAERAVRESERFLASVFDSIQDGLCVLDNDLSIIRVNPAMENWYPHAAPLVGKKCYEAIHNIHQPCQVCPAQHTRDTGEPVSKVVPKRGPEGRPVGWLEIFTFPLTDGATGKVKGIIEYVRDISGRRLAEMELQETNEFLRSLLQASAAGIIYLDQEGKVRMWNRAAGRIYGWEAEEVLGGPVPVILPEQELEFQQLRKRVLRGEAFTGMEVQRQRKDGSLINISLSLAPVRNPQGEVEGTIAIITDITGRKKAEQKIQNLAKFPAENPNPVLRISKDGFILYANERSRPLLEFWGRERGRRLPGEWREIVRKTLAGGVINEMEVNCAGRVYSLALTPIPDMGYLNIYGRDITDYRLAEEALRQKEEEFQQAQKMEAVGRLAGGVAHDFNNLLTAIMGYSELLLLNCEDRQKAHLVEQIMRVAEKASVLIRQLLAFSRRQPLRPVPLDLNLVVGEMEQLLQRVIGEDILLNLEQTRSLALVKADRGQLEQVIVNLAVNARDAMPQGGQLFIKTSNVTLDDHAAQVIPEAQAGDFVVLEIMDTGLGIDKEIRERIFEPFFTTKGPGEGTGLGLSTVYGIVKQHDGWINVYSEAGQGTVFKVYLPAVTALPAEKPQSSLLTKQLQGRGERILLVEDETQVREIATRLLRQKGYDVVAVGSVAEALAVFKEEGGKFQLVFSDVVLADQSGLQLVEELKSRNPGLKVLLTSGYADQKVQWPLIQKEKFPFLQKPYTLKDLLESIAEVLKSDQT